MTISGIAYDPKKCRIWVNIVVNDTLRKFRDSTPENWNNYNKLADDTYLNMYAKTDGKFKIIANTTDNIFFQSFRHIQKGEQRLGPFKNEQY